LNGPLEQKVITVLQIRVSYIVLHILKKIPS
jgi:hypothetical protein